MSVLVYDQKGSCEPSFIVIRSETTGTTIKLEKTSFMGKNRKPAEIFLSVFD